MKRRTVLQSAAGSAMINLFLESNSMSQETTLNETVKTDADAILERLMTKDVPAAVKFDERMRTLIAVASLTAQDEDEVLARVALDALKKGASPLELREAAVQAMAYSGLPTTIRSINVIARRLMALPPRGCGQDC